MQWREWTGCAIRADSCWSTSIRAAGSTIRNGTTEPVYEKDLIKSLGIERLEH
jgi:hypothetical protein